MLAMIVLRVVYEIEWARRCFRFEKGVMMRTRSGGRVDLRETWRSGLNFKTEDGKSIRNLSIFDVSLSKT